LGHQVALAKWCECSMVSLARGCLTPGLTPRGNTIMAILGALGCLVAHGAACAGTLVAHGAACAGMLVAHGAACASLVAQRAADSFWLTRIGLGGSGRDGRDTWKPMAGTWVRIPVDCGGGWGGNGPRGAGIGIADGREVVSAVGFAGILRSSWVAVIGRGGGAVRGPARRSGRRPFGERGALIWGRAPEHRSTYHDRLQDR
jgi:hypothetical protein